MAACHMLTCAKDGRSSGLGDRHAWPMAASPGWQADGNSRRHAPSSQDMEIAARIYRQHRRFGAGTPAQITAGGDAGCC